MTDKKDAYYFAHDYEPTGDPKIQAMLGTFGADGYGLYWRIVEMLHSDINHRLCKKPYVYEAIAGQMSTDVQHVLTFVEACVNNYELFTADDTSFWSERVLRNIEKRKEISDVRSFAGKASALKRKLVAGSEHMLTRVEQNPTKERKGKEKKVNTCVSLLDQVNALECEAKDELLQIAKKVEAHFPRLMEMHSPLTADQLKKLVNKNGRVAVENIFLSMQNRRDLLTKYESAYLTAFNWLKPKPVNV